MVQKTYTLYSDLLPNANPLTVRWNSADFATIDYAELHVTLSALAGLPLFSWKIKQSVVNGKVFYPSNPIDSRNIIHSTTIKSLKDGENIIDIFRDAPLGTGVISPQVQIHVELIVQGSVQLNPVNAIPNQIGNIGTYFKNQNNVFQNTFKDNLPLGIFVAIIAVIVLIALVYLASRLPKVERSDIQAAQNAGQGVKQKIGGLRK